MTLYLHEESFGHNYLLLSTTHSPKVGEGVSSGQMLVWSYPQDSWLRGWGASGCCVLHQAGGAVLRADQRCINNSCTIMLGSVQWWTPLTKKLVIH